MRLSVVKKVYLEVGDRTFDVSHNTVSSIDAPADVLLISCQHFTQAEDLKSYLSLKSGRNDVFFSSIVIFRIMFYL